MNGPQHPDPTRIHATAELKRAKLIVEEPPTVVNLSGTPITARAELREAALTVEPPNE